TTLDDGDVATSEGLTVNAENNTQLTATVNSSATAGDTAVGATLAINTIGWTATDILTKSVDSILGTQIGTTNRADVSALIVDSDLDVADHLSLTATSTAKINAAVSNSATSAASALMGASGMSASGVIATNMVNAGAEAKISYTGAPSTIAVGGNLSIDASDDAAIKASSKMSSVSSTANDGGVSLLNGLVNTLLNDYQYTNNSGDQVLKFGDQVLVVGTDDEGKQTTQQYKFLGATETTARNLNTENYENKTYWKVITDTNILPAGLNLDDSDSIGLGGLVVLNDVQSAVAASLQNTAITSGGDVTVSAKEKATIDAVSEGVTSSSGGSAFGEGTSLAIGGVFAANVLTGGAQATVDNSDITTTAGSGGSLDVLAENNAVINSSLENHIKSGDTAGGAAIAINALGYQTQGLLLGTINALLGTDFNGSTEHSTLAAVTDTKLSLDGGLDVLATTNAKIVANITNDATSEASALVGATGMSVSGVLSSNLVNSSTKATIDNEGTMAANTLGAAGAVKIAATDNAVIDADATMISSSTTTNKAGVDVLADYVGWLDDYHFTSASGTQTLNPGRADYLASEGNTALTWGDMVQLPLGYQLANGDDKGSDLSVYTYVGSSQTLDLSSQDYTDTSVWKKVERRFTDTVRLADDFAGQGDAGGIYRYIGLDNFGQPLTIDLGAENYTNTLRWQKITVDTADYVPDFGNLSDSDSVAVGGLVVRNDVTSDALALLQSSSLTAGAVRVEAIENASISADASAQTSSSGGSSFGEGKSIASQGTIALNRVLSDAKATIDNSDIVTQNTHLSGNLIVDASHSAKINAKVLAATSTGDTAAGVTLAMNTLGMATQLSGFLSNGLEALLGDDTDEDLFGLARTSFTEASITDTNLSVAGDLRLIADSATQLNATISNAAVSEASAFFNATGQTASGLITSNVVNSKSKAFIENTGARTVAPLAITGSLDVLALDNAGIYANTKMVSSSTTTNDGGAVLIDETLGDVASARYQTSDGEKTLEFGDKVRTPDDYANGGSPSAVYRYLGTTGDVVDLATADYSDLGYWQEVLATKFIPQGNNLTDSDAIAHGGQVVRNAVTAYSESYLKGVHLSAADIDVSAKDESTIKAIIDSTSSSSGGSAFGEGKSIAVNGTIALNQLVGEANAYIANSDITTSVGALNVTALNNATLDVNLASMMTTGDTGVGVAVAMNIVGIDGSKVLFSSMEAILGDPDKTNPFGTYHGAAAKAHVQNSKLTVAGDLSVSADNTATINAHLTNDALSAASAFVDASGKAIGVMAATNFVSSGADAFVLGGVDQADATVEGATTIHAQDAASINADTALLVTQKTTNDGGLSLAENFLNQVFKEYQYTSNSGTQTVSREQMVRLDGDYPEAKGKAGATYIYMGSEDLTADLGTVDYTQTNLWVELVSIAQYEYTTSEDVAVINDGDRILLNSDVGNGTAGEVYRYIGSTPLTTPAAIDLEVIDYQGSSDWRRVAGETEYVFDTNDGGQYIDAGEKVLIADNYDAGIAVAGSFYRFLGTESTEIVDFGEIDYANNALWQRVSDYTYTTSDTPTSVTNGTKVLVASETGLGQPGEIYEYIGDEALTINAALDFSEQDFAAVGSNAKWEKVEDSLMSLLPVPINFSDSDSTAVGALFVYNEVYADAESYIKEFTLSGKGNVQIFADETSNITAKNSSKVESSGGGITGDGSSVAVNGTIAANMVLNGAQAYVLNSAITTQTSGDLVVEASNSGTIAAEMDSETSANGTSVGVTLALNVVGADLRGILFDAVDELVGDRLPDTISGQTKAYISNSDINVEGA
ncbi:MAG: beta strand repeat-containing protein, partial [Pontibacterium sp.]